jgi:CO dehydrogenase/acetyl-CoA synthase beta subunit
MTHFVVVQPDRTIVCTASLYSNARNIAAALSRCDSEGTAFSVYSQRDDQLDHPALEITFRNGVKESYDDGGAGR